MSYDESDAARDEFYETLRRELYDELRDEAVAEFSEERLRSFYMKNPDVMRPALEAMREGKWQQDNQRHSAAVVFHVSAIELLLKATVLKPVVYGLVHNEALAEVIVQHTLAQSGFDRYARLLAELFKTLAAIDIGRIMRDGRKPLLDECRALQETRNGVVHRGALATAEEAEAASLVAAAVFEKIVDPMLRSLGLTVLSPGVIVAR